MKKLISAVLAFSVVFGGITAYAEDEFTDNETTETSVIEETEMNTEETDDTSEFSEIYEETQEETVFSEETSSDDVIVSMELPVESDNAFDFILDPQQLITATNAAKYDGASFEEDATMYFKNSEGEYEYSHNSDMLTISNSGNAPLNVTLEVELTGAFTMSQDREFTDKDDMLYVELFDSYGNTVALNEDKKCTITVCVKGEDALDDSNLYSFGLSGMCNAEADWSKAAMSDEDIGITVKWSIEPVSADNILTAELPTIEEISEQTEETADLSETDEIIEESATETEIAESTAEETGENTAEITDIIPKDNESTD